MLQFICLQIAPLFASYILYKIVRRMQWVSEDSPVKNDECECWKFLHRVIAIVDYQVHCMKTMQLDENHHIRVRLADFGLTKYVHDQLYGKENQNKRRQIERNCNLSFDSGHKGLSSKHIVINLQKEAKSCIPEEYMVSDSSLQRMISSYRPRSSNATAAPVAATSSTITPISALISALPAILSGDKAGSSLAVTADEQIQRKFRTTIEPAMVALVGDIVEEAKRKRTGNMYFVHGMVQKLFTTVDKLAKECSAVSASTPSVLAAPSFSSTAATDQHIVDSLAHFLYNFNTEGTRCSNEQIAVQTILTALVDANTTSGVPISQLQQRLGVRWTKSFEVALERRRILEETVVAQQQAQEIEPTSGSCTSLHDALAAATTLAERQPRCDKVDLTFACDWWHQSCRIDTWNKKSFHSTCHDGKERVCVAHTQREPNDVLYRQMISSGEYARWQMEQTRDGRVPEIGLSLFERAKCPCILQSVQHDCADEVVVTVLYALEALGRLRNAMSTESAACECDLHRAENGYADIHKSAGTLVDFLLCPKVDHVALSKPTLGQRTQQADGSGAAAEQEGDVEAVTTASDVEEVRAVEMEGNFMVDDTKTNTGSGSSGVQKKRRHAKLKNSHIAPPSTKRPRLEKIVHPCAYGQCGLCGVDIRLPLTCPVDNAADATVKVRVFRDLPRSGANRSVVSADGNGDTVEGISGTAPKKPKKPRTQREVVEELMTGQQLMQHLKAALRKYLPHKWACVWDLHHRQLFMETFDENTISMMTDFSAVYNNGPQFRLNSAISEHSLQDVWIVSHSPRTVTLPNGVQRRVMDNEAFHFWGSARSGKLDSNHYFHFKCFQWLLCFFTTVREINMEFISAFSDGCAGQYKNRRLAVGMCVESEERNVIIDHTYSPTSSFKTTVDSVGKDAKECMRKLERTEAARAVDARQVFNTLRAKMKQPEPRDEETCPLMSLTHRTHVLLVDKAEAQVGDEADLFIIITDQEKELLDCKPIEGIQSTYNIQSRPEGARSEPKEVWFRQHPCACTGCLMRKRDTPGELCSVCVSRSQSGQWQRKLVLPVAPKHTRASSTVLQGGANTPAVVVVAAAAAGRGRSVSAGAWKAAAGDSTVTPPALQHQHIQQQVRRQEEHEPERSEEQSENNSEDDGEENGEGSSESLYQFMPVVDDSAGVNVSVDEALDYETHIAI